MRFIWSTAVKDWRRRWRNPLEIVMWIGIPILVGSLIALAFGGRSGPRPQAHVFVADNDESFLSRFLVGALSQETAGGFIRAEAVADNEGRARMDKGKATALIVIPKGFSQAVLREEPATLQLVTNPSQPILPGMVEEGLSILADGTFYLHRLIGEDLRKFAEGPPEGQKTFPDEAIAAFSTRINQTMSRLSGYLSPLVIKLETAVDEKESDTLPFGFLLLPMILFMTLLFMAQGLGDDFWEERNQNTIRRVRSSPQRVASFLAGKILSHAGIIFVVCLVALSAAYALLGLNPATMPLALLWAVLSGVVFAAGMTTIQLFAGSQRAGNILTLAITFPLMMAGGSFFPFETMPGWMVGIGTRTPNGWALQRFKDIVLQRTDAGNLLLPFAILLVSLAALLAVCARRLERSVARS
jgi:ABC-type multidrug transport system permease subunit